MARPSRSGSELSELLLSLGAKRGPYPHPPEANSWPVVTRRKREVRVGTEGCRRGSLQTAGKPGYHSAPVQADAARSVSNTWGQMFLGGFLFVCLKPISCCVLLSYMRGSDEGLMKTK